MLTGLPRSSASRRRCSTCLQRTSMTHSRSGRNAGSTVLLCNGTILEKMGDDGTVTVKTEDGLLRGQVATSAWSRTYLSFQSVPYAQPPVGELRFKSPQPARPWAGVRDALEQGTYCIQDDLNHTSASMSEDCLYLNVYIPQAAAADSSGKGLSVLVWIHGGGFVSGSGIKDFYGPDYLMNHTAILVTINYRLGALGFLSLEHPDVASNAGMKDQVAALRWVQTNIAHFGGNPDSVTVFGESAGGISAELLLLSPMSKGLFHHAISQSGSVLMVDFDDNYNGTREAFRLGEALGHNTTDPDDLVKVLRSATAEDIVKAWNTVMADQYSTAIINLGTRPTVDAKIQEGSEVFLTDTPEKLLRAGKAHPVPYITGFNSEEMKILLKGATQQTLDNYNETPELFIPSSLDIEKGSMESLKLAAEIKNFYFRNRTISFDTQQQLVDLLSDIFITYAVHKSTMLHVNYGSSPLYMYIFTYDDSEDSTIKGPGHMDDLPFLFYSSDQPYSSTDGVVVIQHFTGMWVNFAQSGDPSQHESVKWTPVNKINHTYLQLDVELSLHQDALKERMAFWDHVYSTYKQ